MVAFAAIIPLIDAAPLSTSCEFGLAFHALYIQRLPYSIARETDPNILPAIDAATFSELRLFSQYAAAAYCDNNVGNSNVSSLITCPIADNCPLLEAQNQQPVQSVWEFEHSTWTDVTGFIALDPNRNLTVLTFRGSRTFKNWLANLDPGFEPTDICQNCNVWHGFWLSWLEARDGIKSALRRTAAQNPHYRTVVVGHSLGGAIADLAVADFRNDGIPTDLFTYGAPRVGGQEFSDYITNAPAQNGSTYRVTHLDDPVPKLPPQDWGFGDIGPEYWISSGNGNTVTVNDISKFSGDDMKSQGDYGNFNLLTFFTLDVDAHLWYFGPTDSCDSSKDVFLSSV